MSNFLLKNKIKCLDSELERIRQILFWQFQYIKRLSLKDYSQSWTDIVSNILFWEDNNLKSNTIRYIANAILHKLIYGDCSYDLQKVPAELLGDYIRFTGLSVKYGYYLNDIVSSLCPPIELIQFINTYDTTPLPPIPCIGRDLNKGAMASSAEITKFLHEASYQPVSTDNTELNNRANEKFYSNLRNELKDSYLSEESIDTETARLFTKKWEEFCTGDVSNSKEDIEQYKKVFKKYSKVSYQVTSMQSRAIGLFLWDCVNVHELEIKEATNWLRSVFPQNNHLILKNDNDLKENFYGTDQCIQKGAVLKANSKKLYYKKTKI